MTDAGTSNISKGMELNREERLHEIDQTLAQDGNQPSVSGRPVRKRRSTDDTLRDFSDRNDISASGDAGRPAIELKRSRFDDIEDDAEEDHGDPPKRPLLSSVFLPTHETKFREEKIKELNSRTPKAKQRDKRMFANLFMGTLQRFEKDEKKVENVERVQAEKQRAVDEKLEEKTAEMARAERADLLARRPDEERKIREWNRHKARIQYQAQRKAKKVADTEMARFIRAVGFKMNNLKAFPFSRLPRDLQVEVIDDLKIEKKIELFNVTSSCREYLKGVFRGHVEEICIRVVKYGEKIDLKIHVKKFGHDLHFDFLKDRALCQNIFFCNKFRISRSFVENYEIYHENIKMREEELIKGDADVRKIGEWFPNLRFVERLSVSGSCDEEGVGQAVLESLHFKVTKYAEFFQGCLDFLGGRHWQDLLASHLNICENVFIVSYRSPLSAVPKEIVGMEIENDRRKGIGIWETFKVECKDTWFLVHAIYVTQNLTCPPINCYRRKTDNYKEMVMVVWSFPYDS